MNYFDFTPPSTFAINHLFYSDGLGVIDTNNFSIDWRSFRNFLFLYVDSGEFHIYQNGTHIVKPGQFVMMSLKQRHKYFNHKDMPCRLLWMHLGASEDSPILNAFSKDLEVPYIIEGLWMKDIISECIDITKKKASDREYLISTKIYQALMTISHGINLEKENRGHDQKTIFLEMINQYINQHIYEKPSLEDFATDCGFSKYHFCKLFKKYTKDSPIRYFYKRKIDYSKNLLTYTNESIGSLGMMLGFDTPAHFSGYFKKVVGISPKAYKRL